jgi:hypothetical protein
MVKLTHSDLNPKFDMSVVLWLIIFLVEDDVYIDSDTLLVTDFMNLKIKPTQSFKYVLIGMNVHVWVFIKKASLFTARINFLFFVSV